MACEPSWASTKVPGEAGFDGFGMSQDHRGADMQLVSHLVNGYTIMEGSSNLSPGVRQPVYWVVDDV